ncbi:MAG: amidase [Candidatus Binataceae bacterium]
MSIKSPSIEDISRIAEGFGMRLSADDIRGFNNLMGPMLASYERLDELAEPALEVKYKNRKNWKPSEAENPLGGWYWRTEIKGAASGPLTGKTLAIKDNVAVADVPLMCGTRLLEGFVPKTDATIVTRILDAGGTILGKANCENLCFSGNSHTSHSGVARNPYDLTRSPGGSSTGSAALVASSAVDMAIGADQAGSIRIPSSWSGIYGLKPSYGLVPYTGIGPMELTVDHTGPMARTAADVALLLEVIAGPDGLDPRQRGGPMPQKYVSALTGNIKGLKIAVVKEGFGLANPKSEPDVDEAVRKAAQAMAGLGCEISEISIPMHRDGAHIWAAIGCEGNLAFMIEGNAVGRAWKGYYPTDLVEYFAKSVRQNGHEMSVTAKLFFIIGRHMNEAHNGRFYAKAQNLARALTAAYDDALSRCDMLLMPTTPIKATKIPAHDAPIEEQVMRGIEMIPNTSPFNATGHPALNVPCAMSEGLPVGMMLVGRMGEDAAILRAADAFQRNVFSPPAPPKHA